MPKIVLRDPSAPLTYYQRKRAERLTYQKAYYEANCAERLAYGHAYYEENKKERLAYSRDHIENEVSNAARHRARLLGAPINDFTAKQWREMKASYGYRCVYCGKNQKRLTQDHITPLSKGGSHTMRNIVPACHSCNSKKHDRAVLVPVQPLLLL